MPLISVRNMLLTVNEAVCCNACLKLIRNDTKKINVRNQK